jgi:ribosomal protein L29
MKDYKIKNESELIKNLNEKRKALRAFRFGIAGSKTRNVKEGRNTKRDIARILTELNNRPAKKEWQIKNK